MAAPARASVEPSFRGGAGPPLVLLHAAATSWRLWEPLLPLLTPTREVLAPTLLGHYGGPRFSPSEPMSGLGPLVDAVETALDDAGFERPVVVGNSIGGWSALELARRGRARRVVAICPTGMFDRAEVRWLERRLRRQFAAARIGRRFAPAAMRSPFVRRRALADVSARAERVSPALAAHLTRAAALCDIRVLETLAGEDGEIAPIARPEEIEVPVLLLWGDHDRLANRAQMERYLEGLPDARLVELPGLRHCPQLDDPERVAREILAFTDPEIPDSAD
jgi:pimeloyl-ACP methyl ester carboxylesterase